MESTRWALLALCVLVALAGCGGDGGGATTSASGSIPELSSGTADTDYEFVEGETWEYRVTQTESTRNLTLEVSSVENGEVTLTQTFVGDETDESVYRGSSGEILRNSSATLVSLHLPQVLVAGHELSVGNSWTPEENASVDLNFFGTTETLSYPVAGQQVSVTGTDTYAGVECYVVEFTGQKANNYETCVRPDGALALYINRTTETGFQISEWSLTDRSR